MFVCEICANASAVSILDEWSTILRFCLGAEIAFCVVRLLESGNWLVEMWAFVSAKLLAFFLLLYYCLL